MVLCYFISNDIRFETELGVSEKYGTFDQLRLKYKGHTDPKTNKLSHIIWQRTMCSLNNGKQRVIGQH